MNEPGSDEERETFQDRVDAVRNMRCGVPDREVDPLGGRQDIQTGSSGLFQSQISKPKTLQVCWKCEKYWSEDEYEYCPLCSANLVEVEEA